MYYGLDAFEGLRLMDNIVGGKEDELNAEIEDRIEKRSATEQQIADREAKREQRQKEEAEAQGGGTAVQEEDASDVATDVKVPKAPFWGTRLVEQIDPKDVYPFINTMALFRGQWQFRKGRLTDDQYQALIEDEVQPVFERLKQQCREEKILQPQVVYGYFPVQAEGDDLVVFDPEDHDKEVERFTFPRQSAKKKRLCISDFFKSADSGEKDVLGMTCVTMGPKVTEVAQELFANDNYTEYLYMHGMGVESRRGPRRDVAQAHAAGTGHRRRGRRGHPQTVPAEVPRLALQLRLSRVPGHVGPGEALASARARAHRLSAYRELADRSRAVHQRHHRASPRGEVLQRLTPEDIRPTACQRTTR